MNQSSIRRGLATSVDDDQGEDIFSDTGSAGKARSNEPYGVSPQRIVDTDYSSLQHLQGASPPAHPYAGTTRTHAPPDLRPTYEVKATSCSIFDYFGASPSMKESIAGLEIAL